MWKGDCGTDSGVLHRIQLMGDENEPKTYCGKASIRFIRRTHNNYEGMMCLRCDWREEPSA